MSKFCELTGVGPFTGNKVSHSNRKTRTRWIPNLKAKKFFVPELEQAFTFKLSTRAIRTIDKLGGITPALMKAKAENLSERLQKLRAEITKKRRAPVAKTAAAPKA
jgi:large subunit ribosomal protein L28